MATKSPAPAPAANPLPASEAHHRIHILLHTVRCIAQYEDQICTLLHASRNSPQLTAAVRRDLEKLLDRMPAHDYMHDLEAVRELLDGKPATAPR